MNTILRQLSLVAIIAMIGGVFAATPAQAAAIDGSRTGTLTIHKHVQDEEHSSAGSPAGRPLKGVEFTITEVLVNGKSLDLTTAEGWKQAEKVSAKKAPKLAKGFTRGEEVTVTTDASGTAVVDDLSLGLYLVSETDFGDNHVTGAAVSFWVSIPTSGDNGSWTYDVVAYPKNKVATATPSPQPTPSPTTSIDTGIPGVSASNLYLAFGGLLVIGGVIVFVVSRRRSSKADPR